MAIKPAGPEECYEDFEVGDVYRHPLGRTITQTDNIWFTLLTQNTAPLHFDAYYAAQTEFKKPLVNSALTIALVTGQTVTDISQNVFANLGWDEVRLPNPVFEGDTLYSQSEVLDKRESKSRAERGHRDGEDHRLQPGRQDRDHVQAHGDGVQARAHAADCAAEARGVGRGARCRCAGLHLNTEARRPQSYTE